jgi:hypothetical protein
VGCNLELRRTTRQKEGRSGKLPIGIKSFRELSSHIQVRWKKLPAETKKDYARVNMYVKAQYKMELTLHKAALGNVARRANAKRGQTCLARHNTTLLTRLVQEEETTFASGPLFNYELITECQERNDSIDLATKLACAEGKGECHATAHLLGASFRSW